MRAGRLTHTLTIERATTTLSQYRAPVETWSPVTTLKAERLKSAREENENTPGTRTITFRTRFADVRLSDRVLFEGQAFDLEAVEEIGRRKALELRLVARVA